MPFIKRAKKPMRRQIGEACIFLASLILVLWVWLFIEVHAQLKRVSDFESKYAGGGSLFGTMDLPTQEKELQAIINAEVTKKCQEMHNCSLESTRLIGMNFDMMRYDFRSIVAETRSDWKDDDSPSPGPVSRAVLSPFCKVSTGYWPEEIGHPIALLPAPPVAFFLLIGGIIAIKGGKKGETSAIANAASSGTQ